MELGQHWVKLWLVPYSAPKHYLNQWWHIGWMVRKFSFNKMSLKMSSAKCWPFSTGLGILLLLYKELSFKKMYSKMSSANCRPFFTGLSMLLLLYKALSPHLIAPCCRPVALYNSLGHASQAIVRLYVDSPHVEVKDPNGNVIMSQVDQFWVNNLEADQNVFKVGIWTSWLLSDWLSLVEKIMFWHKWSVLPRRYFFNNSIWHVVWSCQCNSFKDQAPINSIPLFK